VLVVDDTVDNLVIISLHLQQSGYRVVTAGDGEEAIKVAALTHPDLILMDISMPGLDGLGATRKDSRAPGAAPRARRRRHGLHHRRLPARRLRRRAWRATSPSRLTSSGSTISSAASCPSGKTDDANTLGGDE
jgi:CheY-like chemotaxis protein